MPHLLFLSRCECLTKILDRECSHSPAFESGRKGVRETFAAAALRRGKPKKPERDPLHRRGQLDTSRNLPSPPDSPHQENMTTDWISSDDAMSWAQETLGFMEAVHLISGRAHEGLIIARAARFRRGDQTQDDVDVPRAFWRGFGYSPLPQIWEVGDFQSQLNDDVPSRAFGVVFRRSDLEKFLPTRKAAATRTVTPLNSGRRPAPWWDDLWIDIARQLFVGDRRLEQNPNGLNRNRIPCRGEA